MNDALLHALKAKANNKGYVIARADALQAELGCSFDELQSAVHALSASKKLRILSDFPFLMVALARKKWASEPAGSARSAEKSGTPASLAYSHSFQSSTDESRAVALEDGGAGEGEALLQEILATLGESDPSTFRGVLEHYAPSHVRAVLRRVRATPPEKIRKSRTALFRFLLAKTK
jgi:hypothetical protein